MFYYDDLNFYKQKEFRSSFYVLEIWSAIEPDLLFLLGIVNHANITIVFDNDISYIIASSNFKTIVDKKYNIITNHSLNLCEDFSIEIQLNIITDSTRFVFDCNKSSLYYTPNKYDEGIIEIDAQIECNMSHFKDIRNLLLTRLAKEVQYAICRNILYLNIEKEDSFLAHIDAYYEVVYIYMLINEITFEESLKLCVENKLVFEEDKEFILEINSLINESDDE